MAAETTRGDTAATIAAAEKKTPPAIFTEIPVEMPPALAATTADDEADAAPTPRAAAFAPAVAAASAEQDDDEDRDDHDVRDNSDDDDDDEDEDGGEQVSDEEEDELDEEDEDDEDDDDDEENSDADRAETPTVPASPTTPADGDARVDVAGGTGPHWDGTTDASLRGSMSSIALSETSLDYDHLSAENVEDVLATPKVRQSRHLRKPSSLEILQNAWPPRPGLDRQSTLFDSAKDNPLDTPITPYDERLDEPQWEEAAAARTPRGSASERSDSTASLGLLAAERPNRSSSLATLHRLSASSGDEQSEVDWQQLERNEKQEKEDKDLPAGAEDESTAFLLARLEQENAKISAFSHQGPPRSITRIRSQSRPPSMGHLKKLVQDGNTSSIRYSLTSAGAAAAGVGPAADAVPAPEPPPMTELEFWAALVQDYPSTASRLPTLTTAKIRAGIPPPLRGVVWTSLAGARDRNLEDAFDRLVGEKSPYEGIINKDVGRSFPGVELFRDAEGEGQRMLGRVLKCFSLQDQDIGYCQGLGFLVGPLLMNMGEKEAFCVLVRLMDHYHLRPSFLPSLSGLHMRIFQFSSLLKQHLPELAEHLAHLGIEPAYLSQWFLSCFAVTCPLPLLFRIYDVIFAEGANETVMRVALALMRRNEPAMLEAVEFEEVMQLLLGRALWDSYGCNPDELVDDFTSLGGIITHARLAELEKEFNNQTSETVGEKAGFLPDVQAAASRFLGRLWAQSGAQGHEKSKASTSTLSVPQPADKDAAPGGNLLSRPGNFLRRSPSKQSIGTLNESTGSEGSTGSGSASLASTAPTDPEMHDAAAARDSQADTMSFKSSKHPDSLRTVSISTGHGVPAAHALSKEERDMHGQIEDLLTALSEMQREQQQLAALLQKEREDRSDDHRVVRQLVTKLKKPDKKGGQRTEDQPGEEDTENGGVSLTTAERAVVDKRRTLPPLPRRREIDDGGVDVKPRAKSLVLESNVGRDKEELDGLVEKVQERLASNARISASFETKAQLRSTLTREREKLAASENRCRDLGARLEMAESSVAAFTSESDDLRSEVKELRIRVNEEFKARQKLELTIRELRQERRSMERKDRERALMAARASGSHDEQVQALAEGVRRNSSASPVRAEGGRIRKGSVASAPVSVISAGGAGGGLRELKLSTGRRDSASSVQSLRSLRTPRQPPVATPPGPAPASQPPQVAVSPQVSEPTSATEEASTPVSAVSASSAGGMTFPSLAPPSGPVWHARTSSLATKEVLSTPQHEVVAEEALLLELVNAKTAEAQARQEVDELRRSLNISNRRNDALLSQVRAELEGARSATEHARLEAASAHAAAEAARADAAAKAEAAAKLFLASTSSDGLSVPTTPAAYDSDKRSLGASSDIATPSDTEPKPKKAETTPTGGGGGWFWNRRTASSNKVSVTPPAE